MQNILLARHATVESSYKGTYVGRTDALLSGKKDHEIKRLAETIKRYKPTAFVCSPLRRTRDTVNGVINLLSFPGQKIQIFPDLQEIDFGCWEGLTYREIEASGPEI